MWHRFLLLAFIFSFLNLSAAPWVLTSDLSGPGPISNPSSVAIDAAGNAVAVWQVLDTIQAATLLAGSTTWSPPVNLTSATVKAAMPQVAISPSGYAVAIWTQLNVLTSTFAVQAAILSSLPSNTWTLTSSLATFTSPIFSLPKIAVDSAGNAVAVWRQNNAGSQDLQGSTLLFGSTVWAPEALISVGNTDTPALAIDPAGDAVTVFESTDGFNTRIFGARLISLPLNTWLLTTVLSDPLQDASNPDVSMDAAGNATAVWERFDGANFIIQSANLPAGSLIWSSPVDLSAAGQDSAIAFVSVNPTGNAVAIWTTSPNGVNLAAQGSTYSVGTGLWTPTSDLTPSTDFFRAESITFSDNGTAVATVANVSFVNTSVGAYLLQFGSSTWMPPDTIGTPFSFNSDSASNANGDFVVTWTFVESGSGDRFVRGAVLRSAIPPGPQPQPSNFKGRVIKNRFLTQTDRIHFLQWTPSSDPSILGYHIYRNGVLIATIPATGPFRYADHNRNKKYADTYVITAFTASGDGPGLEIILR